MDELVNGLADFLQKLLYIIAGVSLIVTVAHVVRGENESAKKAIVWFVVTVVAFILLDVVKRTVSGAAVAYIIPMAKCLDRDVEMFLVKGKWIGVFLLAAAISVIVAFVTGIMVDTSMGIMAFIVLLVASYFGVLYLQRKLPGRRIKRHFFARETYKVHKRETLSRIMLPMEANVKKNRK